MSNTNDEVSALVVEAFAEVRANWSPAWPTASSVKSSIHADEDGDVTLQIMMFMDDAPTFEPGYTRSFRPIDAALRESLATRGIGGGLKFNMVPEVWHPAKDGVAAAPRAELTVGEAAALRYLAQVDPADALDGRIAELLRDDNLTAIGDMFARVKAEGDVASAEAEYLRERRGALLDEVERLRDSWEFTEAWYAARWQRLSDLLRGTDHWHAVCDIMANGSRNGDAPPTYGAMLNIHKFRAESARKDALDEAIAAVNEEGGEYDFVYARRIERLRGENG